MSAPKFSSIVAKQPIEAGRVEKKLLSFGKSRLAAKIEPSGRGLRGAQRLHQAELAIRLEVMDGQAAPRHIGGFGAAGQGFDEVAMIEVHLEGHVLQIARSQFERGLGEINPVLVPRFRARERALHLTRVAAADVEHGKGPGEGLIESVVKDLSNRFMGETVGVHQLLIGRPLGLELLERGFVHNRAIRLKLMDQYIHPCSPLACIGVGLSASWIAR